MVPSEHEQTIKMAVEIREAVPRIYLGLELWKIQVNEIGWSKLREILGTANETTEAIVDTALKRALRQLFIAGLFDQPSKEGTDWTQTITADEIASSEHQQARDDAALQSIVLLQNNQHDGYPLLPVRQEYANHEGTF